MNFEDIYKRLFKPVFAYIQSRVYNSAHAEDLAALTAPVFELEARYWAWRIAEVKDTTLEQLRSYSVQWVGEPAENARMILAIEENLKNGNTKRLSAAEMKKLRKTHEQIGKLISKTKF